VKKNWNWQGYEIQPQSINGYSYSMIFDEHMRINFAGAKSGRDRLTTQILFSGQACREFLEYQGGSGLICSLFLCVNI